jgi:molybdate/tungstate transport system substrate-binding protein
MTNGYFLMLRFRWSLIVTIILVVSLLSGCGSRNSDEVIIFHAGSLSRPFSILATEFEEANPGVRVLLEPAGSLVTARKITELNKPCDIMASADYQVIDQLLIPDYSDWNIGFTSNEMVIAYNSRSKYSDEIGRDNWYEIILRSDVAYGRSDPDSDPCGYRSIFTLMLAEEYYGVEGLAERVMAKDNRFIRPKEIDLIALLESGVVDYIFQYKSVAVQAGLQYLTLPDEINLASVELREHYQSMGTMVAGATPSQRIYMPGDFIIYGVTLINDAPNRERAIDFLRFLFSERGMEIFVENGHSVPRYLPVSGTVEKIPYDIARLINAESDESVY